MLFLTHINTVVKMEALKFNSLMWGEDHWKWNFLFVLYQSATILYVVEIPKGFLMQSYLVLTFSH